MKSLVTGATGFLGRFLCEKLEDVVMLSTQNADLTQSDALRPWDGEAFETIYHLATWTQAGDFSLRHPGEQWILNQKINTHVLEWWQAKQPQAKLVCIGESCGYDPSLPLEEGNFLKGEPLASLYTYAMTKRMLLCGLKALHKQYGLSYLYLIPSTLYGPRSHTDERQHHFIFDLAFKILSGKHTGEEVVLWGDGEQKRELIHVRDCVDALLELAQQTKNRVINLGAGEEHSIKTFARMICEIVDFPFEKIVFDANRYVGARSRSLATQAPVVKTPLREGLTEMLQWCAEQLLSAATH